jgi:microsomal dipeptidase-like Zn-dependent dipeptidase
MKSSKKQLLLALAASALLMLLAAPAAAQEPCGGVGQRGCCVGSTERLSTGACAADLVEVSGCTSGNCACGGSGISVFLGLSSSSRCEAVSACGGPGQRACCITETRWDNNPIPASGGCQFDAVYSGIAGLTEVAGGAGAGVLCGGNNPFGLRSNGTCVTCGTDGAQKCAGVDAADACKAGLTPDAFGFCTSCGRDGQPLCEPDSLCAPGFHPNGGVCRQDRVIAEPDCNCTPESAAGNPAAPVKGYADLHLHMFGNLAFGGLTVWGDAFDKEGGISRALRSDNFAQRTSDRIINGNVIKGISGETLGVDVFSKQTVVHGNLHDADIIGFGTGQHGVIPFTPALANGGVEWDPNFADAANKDFEGWPKWNTTTHQQVYYKWLERAHVGGLQLAVLLGVNNEAMCASQKRFNEAGFKDCNDTMPAVKLQFAKARELEQWLSARCASGVEPTACARHQPAGETQGWFKIVTSPAEARTAIAQGQLAVVLGIEEASLFGCKAGVCTPDTVRAAIDHYYEIGVRHIFPIHNFDNGFGGAATWMDTIGIGNAYSTTEWYSAIECPATPAFAGGNDFGFKLFAAAETDFMTDLSQGLSRLFLGLDALHRPTYPGLTTTCNAKGLTGLGEFMVREMMHRKMIIDVDHMSIRALNRTLDLAQANEYPGIVASHVLMFELAEQSTRHERMRTRAQLQRIAGLGGMIAAMTQPPEGGVIAPQNSKVHSDCKGSSTTWAQMYEYAVDVMTIDGVKPAIAFGTDFNGISAHNNPRFGSDGCTPSPDASALIYPFTLSGFGEFQKQQTGNRVFDFNTQGLAHVGLLPDMVADLRQVGLTDQDLEPLFGSAEAYIRMWEGAAATAVPAVNVSGDQAAPSTVATQAPAKNAENWNNSAVTVTLTASDGSDVSASGVAEILHTVTGSGLTTVTAGEVATVVATTEGLTAISFAARDLAGNQEVAREYTVSIDTIAPTITGARVTPANAAGWNNGPVASSFTCTDTGSGIASCSGPATLTSEGAGQDAVGTATDRAGNSRTATVSGISIDTTAPTITGARAPLANAAGWVNADVVVSFLCADSLSEIAGCTAPVTVSAEAAGQSVVGTATDKAGNTAETTLSGISIDKSAPTILGARAPAANAAGWNNTAVTVTFACADTLSGVASCTAAEMLNTDGAGQSRVGSALDRAGNTASTTVAGISIDMTPPVVSVTGVAHDAIYTLGAVPSAGCQTTDALSGVATPASVSLTGGNANNVGTYTATCGGATDVAGNGASATATYFVRYPFAGFFEPVSNPPSINRSTAGATLPLKFNLGGSYGLAILQAGSPSSVRVGCESSAPLTDVDEVATNVGYGLTYDAESGQYHYNWKTEKSWKGSCRLLSVALDDGSIHTAIVMFR